MRIPFTLWVLISILSSQSFAQYARNSSALSNIELVNNPNIETSVQFKCYGSSDEIPWVGEYGITETVEDIMEREKNNPTIFNGVLESRAEFESPRKDLPPTPSLEISQWPPSDIPFYPSN